MQESFESYGYLVAKIAYDGSAFYGSQIQKDKKSVNGVLSEMFANFGLYGKVLAAGRTDKGVHALGNVVAIPLAYMPSDLDWLKAQMNQKLFPHIQIISLRIASCDFHPRFSARARHYRYVVSTRKWNVFTSRYFYFFAIQDMQTIIKAIQILEGQHDFSYFSKASVGSDRVREIFHAHCYPYKDFFIFSFLGNGFLHSQVRLMVFALLQIGIGKMNIKQLQEQLELKKRYTTQAAPAEGLYLCRVHY